MRQHCFAAAAVSVSVDEVDLEVAASALVELVLFVANPAVQAAAADVADVKFAVFVVASAPVLAVIVGRRAEHWRAEVEIGDHYTRVTPWVANN